MNNNKYISIFLFLVFFSFTIIHPQIVDRRTPVVRVVEQVGPAIVNISTERIVKGHFTPDFDEFFDEFFGGYRHKIFKTKSLGSGVIVDRSGFIVTNEHVIQRASKITIILSDGRKFQAQVLGSNSQNDIALLKIDTTMSLTSIKWANSDDILIGETAIALGNPFGLKNSVTTGVLSATNRTLSIRGKKTFHDYIQTDAAINPGNSGGALLNILGELVGINTAIYAKGRGLGFAIPSKRVREVIGTLIDYEKDKKFHLGLEFEEDFAKNRVKVSAIHPKSPANNIKVGDIIVRINGQRVQSIFDLKKILYQKQAGDRIRLIVKSAGTRKRQVSITLKKRGTTSRYQIVWTRLGFLPYEIDGYIKVRTVRTGSSASRIGMKAGDIIISLGGYNIETINELIMFLNVKGKKTIAPIILLRNGKRLGGNILVQ